MALKIYEVEFADLKQAYFRCTSRVGFPALATLHL